MLQHIMIRAGPARSAGTVAAGPRAGRLPPGPIGFVVITVAGAAIVRTCAATPSGTGRVSS
jgi:hypothetical protein